MSGVPGPRTSPTVKSLANSSQRNLRAWQITLGPVGVVLLVGIVTGCMACSFYLGFFSGQKVGLETALNNNLASAIRIPITGEDLDDTRTDDSIADVYAKLDESKPNEKAAAPIGGKEGAQTGTIRAKPIPELEAIKSTDAAPVTAEELGAAPEPDLKAVKNALQEKHSDIAAAPPPESSRNAFNSPAKDAKTGKDSAAAQVRVLGQGHPDDSKANAEDTGIEVVSARDSARSETTLGNLRQQQEAESSAKTEALEKKESDSAKNAALESENAAGKANTTKAQEAPKKTAAKEDRAAVTKTAEKVVQEKPKESASFPKPSHGWFAQVAAPNNKAEADALAQRMKKAGFPVAIENATVRGQDYYRVLVGPEDSRSQAERLIGQLKRESFVKTDPFLRMVK